MDGVVVDEVYGEPVVAAEFHGAEGHDGFDLVGEEQGALVVGDGLVDRL